MRGSACPVGVMAVVLTQARARGGELTWRARWKVEVVGDARNYQRAPQCRPWLDHEFWLADPARVRGDQSRRALLATRVEGGERDVGVSEKAIQQARA
jgi:hypothetical protein